MLTRVWKRLNGLWIRNVRSFARLSLLIGMVVVTPGQKTFSQSSSGVNNLAGVNQHRLVDTIEAERKQGVLLSYTQQYRSHGQPVRYKGTLYLAITAFSAKNCDVAIATIVADRYSGRVGKKLSGDTQYSYKYSAEVPLTPEVARSLSIVQGRPNQLEWETHPACTDQDACKIYWLEFQDERPTIRLNIRTDDNADYDGDVTTFDGMVNQFRVPLSSADKGKELVSMLQSFAATCRQ